MSFDSIKNLAKVTVSTTYGTGDTSIVLSGGDGSKLPDPSTEGAFNLVWWNSTDYADPSDDPKVEIVRCTVRSTDTLTVTRAQESTIASTKNNAACTYKMSLTVTKKTITDIISTFLNSKITSVTSASYNVVDTDHYIYANATSNAITINLPEATGSGRVLIIKKIDSSQNIVTLNSDGSASTIDDEYTQNLTIRYDSLTVQDAFANKWYIN
jgi:hypothetical protein